MDLIVSEAWAYTNQNRSSQSVPEKWVQWSGCVVASLEQNT